MIDEQKEYVQKIVRKINFIGDILIWFCAISIDWTIIETNKIQGSILTTLINIGVIVVAVYVSKKLHDQ